MLNCGFAELLCQGLSLSFKVQCVSKIEGGLCGCHVVARTQGYHLVCIWGSPVKFQGDGVVLKVDVFSHCYAVFLCMEANYDPLS